MDQESGATFDKFLQTAASSDALAAATAFASATPDGPHMVFLYGPAGVGKTHLLGAIVNRMRASVPGPSIVQVSGRELVQDLTAAVRGNDETALERYSHAEVIAVDDLHTLARTPVTQREVARLLKAALDTGARVACAAGCVPAEISELAAELGRLPGAALVEMRRPNGRGMRKILAALATAVGLHLSRRTLASIAARCHGDVRRGIGAITRLRFEQSR